VDRVSAERGNATLCFAVLGAVVAGAAGAAGGLARRSPRGAAIAAVVGACLGAVFAAVGSFLVLPFYFQRLDVAQEELSREVLFPLLIHAGIWACAGAAAGLALGLGLARKNRVAPAVLGGLIGSVLGALIYEVVGAVAFPSSKTTQPLAEFWAPRLLACLCVALLATSLAAVAATSPARKGADA
jgi:hypothetical protein